MKILQYADVHARNEDLDEIQRCTGHILDVAGEEQPDLIIDCGDIFDSPPHPGRLPGGQVHPPVDEGTWPTSPR